MEKIQSKQSIIFGDFNLDTIQKSNNTIEYMNFMKLYNMHIFYENIITRKISGTCLDHIFTNNICRNYESQHLHHSLFDHDIIFLETSSATNNNEIINTVSFFEFFALID